MNATASAPAPFAPDLKLSEFNGPACTFARKQLQWSAEQLAVAAGLATLTVTAFEDGRRAPRAGTLIAIRRALQEAGREQGRPPAQAVLGATGRRSAPERESARVPDEPA